MSNNIWKGVVEQGNAIENYHVTVLKLATKKKNTLLFPTPGEDMEQQELPCSLVGA